MFSAVSDAHSAKMSLTRCAGVTIYRLVACQWLNKYKENRSVEFSLTVPHVEYGGASNITGCELPPVSFYDTPAGGFTPTRVEKHGATNWCNTESVCERPAYCSARW